MDAVVGKSVKTKLNPFITSPSKSLPSNTNNIHTTPNNISNSNLPITTSDLISSPKSQPLSSNPRHSLSPQPSLSRTITIKTEIAAEGIHHIITIIAS
jgi:hypothetical protein